MSGIPSAITEPRIEGSVASGNERLEQLLRQQRLLAWMLATGTLTLTVTFFAMMTLGVSLMSRVVLGRSITFATVAAATIILLYLASIAFFGRRADRIDEQLRDLRSEP